MSGLRLSLRNPLWVLMVVLALFAALPREVVARTFVIPHVLEKSGRVSSAGDTFDTSLFMVYTAGQVGTPPGSGAIVDMYLFDDTGAVLKSSTSTDVCNPCTYSLGNNVRKLTLSIDTLIELRGGFGGVVKTGYALIVVSGADPDTVRISGQLLRSNAANDLDITPLDIQPLSFDLIFYDGFEFMA